MHIKIRGKGMAKPGKKKKVLFVLEIIVLLLYIGGLYVYGQISSRLDKIEQPELKKEKDRDKFAQIACEKSPELSSQPMRTA